MAYKRILLKRGKEDSLRRFHPWVFSGAIARLDDGIEEGDVVDVCTNDGKFIAVGHYQIGSRFPFRSGSGCIWQHCRGAGSFAGNAFLTRYDSFGSC